VEGRVAAEQTRARNQQLKQQVDDLDAKLTAMVELKKRLEPIKDDAKRSATHDEVMSALALQQQVRNFELEPPASAAGSTAVRKTALNKRSVTLDPVQQNKNTLDVVRHALRTASAFGKELKVQLGKDLQRGEEPHAVNGVMNAAASYRRLINAGPNVDELKKENAGLRGQVAFFKKRLDAWRPRLSTLLGR